MTVWQLIKSPKLSGSCQMKHDLQLFSDFEKGLIPPVLRLYSWKPKCLSLGYSQKADELIDEEKAKKLGWDLVRRPTGGGIVFHNEAEITYSLVMALDDPALPKGLVSSYLRISQAVIGGLGLLGINAQITNYTVPAGRQELQITNNTKNQILNSKLQANLCFSYPAEYEIVVGGKKIVGGAQKRGKRTLLQQGSIFVRNDFDGVFSVLKEPVDWEWYTSRVISVEEIIGREVNFEELCEALIDGFSSVLHFGL